MQAARRWRRTSVSAPQREALGLIRERLDEEHQAAMLEGMPPPVRQLWLDEWEPAYVGFIGDVRAIAPIA